MSLSSAHRRLGWPTPEQILHPTGAGPKVFARLAAEKIGKSIQRFPGGAGVKVGVLTGNPESDSTEAPVGIVCEFTSNVPVETLWEAHRLAWNFCRCPLLLTLEANMVRAWTCCEPPSDRESAESMSQVVELHDLSQQVVSASEQAAQSLHWVELMTGSFFRKHPDRFQRERRADEMLLSNLGYVRTELKRLKLDSDTTHDLLARIIFIQFLIDRKDSEGVPALNEPMLQQLRKEGTLHQDYTTLSEILLDHADTYRLFRWLNSKFNGDLFPGKGATPQEQEAEWRAEMAKVEESHLKLLADFVAGRLHMSKGQGSLWPLYSFDAIPLEFISSIYEMFVGTDA
ncbi:MAG: SAM-dependent DNA methyltransferase, partial [Tepidisphaerales bacterium]